MSDTATIQLPQAVRPGPDPRARRDHRWAWWSLLLFLPSLAAAIAVGELLATAYGYSGFETSTAPGWLAVAVGYPALLVFTAPALLTSHYGMNAVHRGVRGGVVPVCVAWALPLVFLVQNLLAWKVG